MVNGRKNKKSKEPDSEPPGIELVFSGFVLILLCFFIMLSSFASIEDSNVLKFVKSFSNAVSILTGGLNFDPGKTVVLPGPNLVDKNSDLSVIFGHLKTLTKHLRAKESVSVSSSEKGAVMRLSDTVLFNLGKADFLPEAFPFLEKVSDIIKKTSGHIRIEGHTDDLPIRTERFPSNWELSTARAVNCLRFFVEKGNISPKRLSAAGFGEFQPLVLNDSPENRARNRRVEIVFVENDREPVQESVEQ